MKNFKALDDYLNQTYPIGYWQEEAAEYGGKILSKFKPAEWQYLKENWNDKPTIWQEKLTYALYEAHNPPAVDLLCDMLKAENLDVAIAAMENLDGCDDIFEPDESIQETLKILSNRIANRSKGK